MRRCGRDARAPKSNLCMEILSPDVAVIGGGVGGCAAALALAGAGRRVVMTEEHAWIGGQLTSQAVPPDEHGWIERFGCTRTYRRFRELVRSYYRTHYPQYVGLPGTQAHLCRLLQ